MIFQSVGFGGEPLPFGYLYSYIAGTATPQATWTDSTQVQQNLNPVKLNVNGQAPLWLDPGLTYKFKLTDALGNQVYTTDQVQGSLTAAALATILTQSYIGAILYPQTLAEAAANVTPVNYFYPPGNVNRYGTNTMPGTTDMATPINNALLCNARVYAPSGTYLIGTQLTLNAGNIFYGDGSSTILNFSSTANADFVVGNNISGAMVSDLKLVATGVSTSNNYQGVLAFRGCTNCRAQSLDISGFYADGINLTASVECYVEDNYIHGVTGSLGSQSDIHVNSTTSASSLNNVVANNRCFGGGDFGVSLFQTNTTGFPIQKCLVIGNRVGQHNAYGIVLYDAVAAGVDCWNQVIGNYVENIQGVSGANNNYGAGIYVANQGGCIVNSNTVRNCCVSTAGGLLTPAGIGLNLQTQLSVTHVADNTILDMAQGNSNGVNIAGIYVVNAGQGVDLLDNTISQQVAGGIQTGIYVQAPAQNVTISGGSVNILNSIASTRGVWVYASGANITNVTISSINILGCSVAGMEIANNGAFTLNGVSIGAGININGGASASIGMLLSGLTNATINGVTVSCGSAIALDIFGACTQTRVTGCTFVSTGAAAVATGGVCTASMLNESNYISSSNGTGLNAVTNSGTLFNIRQLGTAAPGSGTQILGDTVYNIAGVTPFAWSCTTAGSPGTFTALTLP